MASALSRARERLAARKKVLATAKAAVKKAQAAVAETARTVKRLTSATGPQRMSPAGVEFLVREEGLLPYAYNDPAGHATFGVGHLIHLGNVTRADELKWGSKLHPSSRERAISVFKTDLQKYEKAVRANVGRRLKPHQFDALCSLCFNIGVGGIAKSSAAREAKAGHWQAAADAILLWDKPSILKARRQRERTLFLSGRYR